MTIFSDLQVLAQLAMTLAGFTGLIGVFQQRSNKPLTDRQKLHVATLLLTAVLVIVLSFVPSWLALIPGSEDNLWEWSIRVLLGFHLLAWAISLPISKFGKVNLHNLPRIERNIGHIVNLLGIFAVIVEVAIVGGFWVDYSQFVYEGVVLFFLLLGIGDFLSLLLNPDE